MITRRLPKNLKLFREAYHINPYGIHLALFVKTKRSEKNLDHFQVKKSAELMPNIEKIENKVPPTLLAAIAGIIIWLASSPRAGKSLLEIVALNSLLPLAACGAGLLLIASAVLLFRDHGATLDPINLDKPTRLVTNGVYRFSRNPMYLGLALLLLAEILLLGVYWAIIFIPVFLVYVHRFQVIPEERALSARFGQVYQNYQQKTKRWL